MIEERDDTIQNGEEQRHAEAIRIGKTPFQRPHDDSLPAKMSIRSTLVGDDVPLFLAFRKDEYDGDIDKIWSDDDDDTCHFGLGMFSHFIHRKRNRNRVAYEIAAERVQRDMQEKLLIKQLTNVWKGDIGFAVFAPLNVEVAFSSDASTYSQITTRRLEGKNNRDDPCNDQTLYSCSSEDEIHFITAGDDIQACPPILSYEQMRDIHERGLPPPCRIMSWVRTYSLRRDGDCFFTMFNKCNSFKHTLIVIKTTDGDTLGGYADTLWNGSNKDGIYQKSNTFFGGGQTFLFASNPDIDRGDELTVRMKKMNPYSLHIYPWSGENEYSQICDLERGRLGMGGGGSFGFLIEKDFTIGSSGCCSTFHNPPLTKGDDGNFHILDVEVYGFSNFTSKLTDCPSSGMVSLSSMMSITSLFQYDSSS